MDKLFRWMERNKIIAVYIQNWIWINNNHTNCSKSTAWWINIEVHFSTKLFQELDLWVEIVQLIILKTKIVIIVFFYSFFYLFRVSRVNDKTTSNEHGSHKHLFILPHLIGNRSRTYDTCAVLCLHQVL